MKILIFVFFLLFIQTGLFSQDFETFEFEDGSSIDVRVVTTDPDEGLKGNVYAGLFTPTGHVGLVGYNHYIPTKMYINGTFGLKGGLLDASFFLYNKTKNKTLKQSVKSSSSGDVITKHVIRLPTLKRRSIGVHTGIEVLNYEFSGSDEEYKKQAVGFIGGLSVLGARYANLKMKTKYKERQGSLVNRLNLDFMIYPFRKIGKELQPDETIDEFLGLMGLRIYYDGRASVWSRNGRVSLNYMLGVNVSTDSNATPLILGIGFGYGFY